MTISLKQLLKNADFNSQSQEIQDNLTVLLDKANRLEEAWGQSFVITSGLRTKEDQLRIYKAKGISEDKIPWGSQHLHGGACDIYDPDGKLKAWAKENEDILEEIGLWCEALESTPTWLHIQIVPPKSGARFFKP